MVMIGKRTNGTAAPASAAAAPGAPGKRTLTDELGASMHAQLAEACDGGGVGCFLEREDRRRLRDRIRTNLWGAAQKWQAELLDARLERVAQHETGWNAIWECAFMIVTAAITDGALSGLAAAGGMATSVEAIKTIAPIVNASGEIEHALKFVAKGLRIPARVAVNAHANRHNASQASFLATIQDRPVDWAVGMDASLGHVSDCALILALGTLDPVTVLTAAAFRAQIEALLARYHEQVERLGEAGAHTVESCAWVSQENGMPRLARVTRFGGRPETFRGWVDDDMVSAAIAADPPPPGEVIAPHYLVGLIEPSAPRVRLGAP